MEDAHVIVQQFDALIRHAVASAVVSGEAPQSAAAASSVAPTAGTPAAPASAGTQAPPSLPSLLSQLGTQSFFGVYDGHGGREAAEYIRDHLHVNVAKRMAQRVLSMGAAGTGTGSPASVARDFDLGDAMKLGAADTEAALLSQSLEWQSTAGAVVAFTIFAGMQLYVAHAGDSRAVLCRDGRALDLTQDHKPGLESEQSRVSSLGGFISDGCVNGEIQVSRALGDVNLSTRAKMLGLSAEVQLSKFYLSDEDEFVIIACDGLWDVLNSASAVAYARHCLLQHNDIQRCADELVQQALRQHSSDNVSVIVIGFLRTLPLAAAGPDGDVRVIVPRSAPRPPGSRGPRERHLVPPRPERLMLNEGGRNKLMQALAEVQSTQHEREEEEQETEEEDDDEGDAADEDTR